ncbi:shikimate kinase [Brevibacterium sp. ZH18]|uniref:shikimate kinase n=1 Tax=Brevibacterium sp. ZH18 TaxID=2927784 RepID=UPI001F61A2E8|nr:shikimate kinase [Brevibacterium sp. ZH18]MCI4012954.1 shikimate kinase [Brevibacterium sp. ZH18]
MTETPLPKPVPPLEPVPAAHSRIVLTGPPAAGKSTIGRLLADRLDLPLIDTDANIVDQFGVIGEIFVERGEDYFRRIEREVVRKALRRLLDRPGIVSLGGGAILNSGTRAQLLHPAIKVVHIDIDVETVSTRVNSPHRPLLRGAGTPVDNWLALVKEREPLYSQVATFRVQASNSPPSTIVNRVVDVLTGLQRAEEYAKYTGREGD